MKMKRILGWVTATFAVVAVAGTIGVASWKNENDTKKASAYEGEDCVLDDAGICEEPWMVYPEGGDITGNVSVGAEDGGGAESVLTEGVDGEFPLRYDARLKHDGVRIKNQHTEETCWLYSAVAAFEHSLAEQYSRNYEASVKHLDYQIIRGYGAYKENNAQNLYFERYASAPEYNDRGVLGGSGGVDQTIYGFLNPTAVVSEADFFEILKKNDSRIQDADSYEGIWDLSNHDEILTKTLIDADRSYYLTSYAEKLNYDEVNDLSKVDYFVSGAGTLIMDFDIARTADDEKVKIVKNLISKYGAIRTSVHMGYEEKCTDTRTIGNKEKYTFIKPPLVEEEVNGDVVKTEICKTNHGMTIVGWDDEWEYTYTDTEGNTTVARGAYILQNSYGEKIEDEWGSGGEDRAKWHLGYMSALPMSLYFDSIEEMKDYAYYYGLDHYGEQTIASLDDEMVFELSSEGDEELKAFVFGWLSGNYAFDVYVSESGKEDDFKKDGVFVSRKGITKYTFDGDYEVNGKYAVKLKRQNGGVVPEINRTRSVVNILSNRILALSIGGGEGDANREICETNEDSCSVVIPEYPYEPRGEFVGYTDVLNGKTAKYQPGETMALSGDKMIYAVWADDSDSADSDEEDLPVPSTAGGESASAAGKPNTGKNASNDNIGGVALYIMPGVFAVIIVSIFMKRRNKNHRKFDW